MEENNLNENEKVLVTEPAEVSVNEESSSEKSSKPVIKGYISIKLMSENELLGEVSLRHQSSKGTRYNVVYSSTGNSMQDIVDDCLKVLNDEFNVPNTNVEVSINSYVVDIIVEREKKAVEESIKRDMLNIKNTYINLLENSILDLTEEQTREVKAGIKLLGKILDDKKND